jgi:hypothetical protein
LPQSWRLPRLWMAWPALVPEARRGAGAQTQPGPIPSPWSHRRIFDDLLTLS